MTGQPTEPDPRRIHRHVLGFRRAGGRGEGEPSLQDQEREGAVLCQGCGEEQGELTEDPIALCRNDQHEREWLPSPHLLRGGRGWTAELRGLKAFPLRMTHRAFGWWPRGEETWQQHM